MVKVFSASGSCPHPVCLCKAADRRVVGTGTGINTPSCEGLGMRGAPWALWGKPQLDFLTGALVQSHKSCSEKGCRGIPLPGFQGCPLVSPLFLKDRL